jgi:hypothetical protein
MTNDSPAHTGWTLCRKILTTLAALAAVIVLVSIGAALGGTGSSGPGVKQADPPAASTPATSPATSPATPAAAPPLHATRVHFIVTGTGNPSITYGSDSDNRDGGGTLGILGDGNTLPWRASMRFRSDAQYYSIDAQLESGGDIHCKIVITGPGMQPLTVSGGHASGQSNICSAQAAPEDPAGSSWQNEG